MSRTNTYLFDAANLTELDTKIEEKLGKRLRPSDIIAFIIESHTQSLLRARFTIWNNNQRYSTEWAL